MWNVTQSNITRCLNVFFSDSSPYFISKKNSKHHKKLNDEYPSTLRRVNGNPASTFPLLKTMFIWSLILAIMMCPSVLSQSEDEGTSTSLDSSDTADLTSDNPCKTNPCGNGVCLVDKEM